MVVREPQAAGDYDDRTTGAVKSVLVEIGQILGSLEGKFAIIAGAVPWLLLGAVEMQHVALQTWASASIRPPWATVNTSASSRLSRNTATFSGTICGAFNSYGPFRPVMTDLTSTSSSTS